MILKAYCIYDSKSQIYGHLSYYKETAEAIRAFGASVNSEKSEFFAHAEDYSLYEIGSYDDSTGLHSSYLQPLMLMSALNASHKHKEFYAARQFEVLKQNSQVENTVKLQ